ncbi:hypothetical protein BDR07DRAFT_1444720 [Suillus spraguei]|nr:hypothetical protein BDR07DRAFT_1444720 [Suillus spraguei]
MIIDFVGCISFAYSTVSTTWHASGTITSYWGFVPMIPSTYVLAKLAGRNYKSRPRSNRSPIYMQPLIIPRLNSGLTIGLMLMMCDYHSSLRSDSATTLYR